MTTTSAGTAVEAIREALGAAMPEHYVGPEGDYLRLVQKSPRDVDLSISSAELPAGLYAVQVCLDGDPLAIAFDDETDLDGLVAICRTYLSPLGNAAPDPGRK